MTRDQIRTKIQEILRDVVNHSDVVITDSTVADDVADWNSTNHVRLILGIEEEFEIRFETDEAYELETVGDIVDLVKVKLGC